ncbi:MAG TPA: hypothetical protein VGS22_08005 [Thermoanaerobaculia bacterium]|jgi:hypothetical protein|nr:hypothetical protein [Thermoanaerobaculia bacterium]
MSSAFTFNTPADIHDFPEGSPQDVAVCSQWNTNMTGFTQQAILGNPWNLLYASKQYDYFDTTVTPIPPGSTAVIVTWHAFPNRLNQYLGSGASPANPYGYTNQQLLAIADQYGTLALPVPAFQQIPTVVCPQASWQPPLQMYGPYGPRGWQDEYCEWCVVRDPGSQKITRIDFTCENPEYWNTLWMVDPQKVADLYTSTLNWDAPAGAHILVKVEDLKLYEPGTQKEVIDPSTGRAAYNALNKWNTGPAGQRPTDGTNPNAYSGGAMHLTATPNTLQTEMQLAGGATIQRVCGNTQAQILICCAQYGQAYRNSDPHIGQSVNQVVSGPNQVALANPSGLYIQVPDLSTFRLPADPNLPPGATAQDCWQIVRGSETLIDPITGLPYGVPNGPGGNFVLHAVFQIPSAWVAAGVKFTVGDILDGNGQAIQWGGQVVQQMDVGLWARPIPLAQTPADEDCVLPPPSGVEAPPDSPEPPDYAQPLQLFAKGVWDAYYNTPVPNPMNMPLPLASNSTLIAPKILRGTGLEMVITCTAKLGPGGERPTVDFGPGITASVTAFDPNVFYAVPGNSYPSTCAKLSVFVLASQSAALGLRGVAVINFGDPPQPAMPAMLNVVTTL